MGHLPVDMPSPVLYRCDVGRAGWPVSFPRGMACTKCISRATFAHWLLNGPVTVRHQPTMANMTCSTLGQPCHGRALGCVRKTFFGSNFSLVGVIIRFGPNMPLKKIYPVGQYFPLWKWMEGKYWLTGSKCFLGILAPRRMIPPTRLK